MINRILKNKKIRGNVLTITLLFTGISFVACMGMAALSMQHYKQQNWRINRNIAYQSAENAALEVTQYIANNEENTYLDKTFTLGGSEPLPLSYAKQKSVTDMQVEVKLSAAGVPELYDLVTSATSNGVKRRIYFQVLKNPPSRVFDYEYFLNNWGWWWGSSITGNGPNRSNWDFDFKDRPKVNGHVYTHQQIESNLVPVDPFGTTNPFDSNSLAGKDPLTYCHIGTSRITMPNLKSLTEYEKKAKDTDNGGADPGTIKQGGVTIVNGVQGDDAGEKSGLYLSGTDANPIVIDGAVVVRGDVIVKGKISGKGTLYVGGNLYLAGDTTYKNGPDFSTPPSSMTQAQRDTWVANNIAADKDLVAFAVKESIFAGQVNNTYWNGTTNNSNWKSNVYDAGTYGLKNIGNEAKLGRDGIAGTADDNIKYRDTNGDGVFDSTWYDADDDGVVDGVYNYDTQIKMTQARANNIQNYPSTNGTLTDYTNVATDQYNRLDGVFYCNHAFGLKTNKSGSDFRGSIICKDEAIIFTGSLKFSYDERLHSRYHKTYYQNDPNRIIDLGLPVTTSIVILERYELAANH